MTAAHSARTDTKTHLLRAGKQALLDGGYANLSTRRIAELAEVPLSQIHYHFGSRQRLVLAVLEAENRRLLERQSELFGSNAPLWQQWEEACDYLDHDLESGYVRVLQEMAAAGWSDPEIAEAMRSILGSWYDLLITAVENASERIDGFGSLSATHVAALVAVSFLGAETVILLGFDDRSFPARSALRAVGELLRHAETPRTERDQ